MRSKRAAPPPPWMEGVQSRGESPGARVRNYIQCRRARRTRLLHPLEPQARRATPPAASTRRRVGLQPLLKRSAVVLGLMMMVVGAVNPGEDDLYMLERLRIDAKARIEAQRSGRIEPAPASPKPAADGCRWELVALNLCDKVPHP